MICQHHRLLTELCAKRSEAIMELQHLPLAAPCMILGPWACVASYALHRASACKARGQLPDKLPLCWQGSRGGHGPNAFAACVGRPRLPGTAPPSARAGDAVPGLSSGGSGGLAGSAAAHTSPAVVAAAETATFVAAAATPLVAPPQPSPEASNRVADCPTIGPEIRAAARTPPGSPIAAGTLAAAAAALHHGSSAELPAELAPAACGAGEDASYKYALPRALWPPAPVLVPGQEPPLAVEAGAVAPDGAAAAPDGECQHAEASADVAVAAAAAIASSGKVTPQVGSPDHWQR